MQAWLKLLFWYPNVNERGHFDKSTQCCPHRVLYEILIKRYVMWYRVRGKYWSEECYFKDVAQCASCRNRRFGGTFTSQNTVGPVGTEVPPKPWFLQDPPSSGMWRSSETSVPTGPTLRHIPEVGILHSQSCGNLKFWILKCSYLTQKCHKIDKIFQTMKSNRSFRKLPFLTKNNIFVFLASKSIFPVFTFCEVQNIKKEFIMNLLWNFFCDSSNRALRCFKLLV
jgi:hypothetical protein